MSIFHVVALKAQEDCLSALIPAFLALQQECKKNGKLYIKSLRGGKQISKEQWHGELNVVFLFEFASQADLDYYIDQDEKHQALKKRFGTDFKVESSVVVDFDDEHSCPFYYASTPPACVG